MVSSAVFITRHHTSQYQCSQHHTSHSCSRTTPVIRAAARPSFSRTTVSLHRQIQRQQVLRGHVQRTVHHRLLLLPPNGLACGRQSCTRLIRGTSRQNPKRSRLSSPFQPFPALQRALDCNGQLTFGKCHSCRTGSTARAGQLMTPENPAICNGEWRDRQN